MRCYVTLSAVFVSLVFLAPATRAQVADPALGGGDPFITTWDTTNPGASNNDQISIPVTGSGYNFTVDWGDGTTTTWQDGDDPAELTHTYPMADDWTIEITGDFPRIHFFNDGNPSDAEKIESVDQWGDIAWSTMANAFRGASNLEVFASDAPDLSGVTSLQAMFWGASSFTGTHTDMNSWDVSSITGTGMQHTFFDASAFNGDISGWDVSNAHIMTAMFAEASSFNQPIGSWDVSNVISMQSMFSNAVAFNQDIGGWDVSNVNSMNGMFSTATAFNQDISGWDMSGVTITNGMFFQASAFNQPIGSWDVSNVTTMFGMFWFATAFNQDISGWDVSNVTNMEAMFRDAASYNQILDSWDVSSVTNMAWMFFNATAFDQNLPWDVGNVTDMYRMLNSSGISPNNYDAILSNWGTLSTLQDNVELNALTLEYCTSANYRQRLINEFGWTINGDTPGSGCVADPVNAAGWRLIGFPATDRQVQDLADLNLVQGISDSYPNADANLFVNWDGPTSSDYASPSSLGDFLQLGKGFFWYFFDDTDFPGFIPPEFVDIEAFELPVHGFSPPVTGDVLTVFDDIPDTNAGDLPAYMLANPFQAAFQLAGVSVDGGTLQTNFYAWDPETPAPSYETLGIADFVHAWQGFWAEVDGGTSAPTFSFPFGAVDDTQDPPFIGLRTDQSFALDLALNGTLESGRGVSDRANRIRFEEDAMTTWDRHDGSKFYPPISMDGYALLSLDGIRKGDSYRQAVRSLPSSLDEATTIPLSLLTTEGGTFTLSADAVDLPEGWGAVLHDLTAGEEADLLTTNYTFSADPDEEWQDRFEITITPAGVSGTEDGPIELHLSNPTPNPANASTALVLRVPDTQTVTARVYDALGRLVTIAHNGRIDAGEETLLTIDTASLAAGAYVVRVEGEAFAETRRFTVVR